MAILAFNIDRKTTNDIQAKGDILIGQFLFMFLVVEFNVIKLFQLQNSTMWRIFIKVQLELIL